MPESHTKGCFLKAGISAFTLHLGSGEGAPKPSHGGLIFSHGSQQIQSADEAKGAIEASRPIETDITSQTKTKRESGAQRI